MKKLALLILIAHSILSFTAYAFEKPTHMAINREIATRNINNFQLDLYVKNQLGLSKGVEEEFNGQQILAWLGEGGKTEDEPDGLSKMLLNKGRSNNHFHNPLKSWDKAGLDCTFLGEGYTGQSSILWAQNPNQNPGGKWSWSDARKYFLQGLTATTQTSREEAFANTFRALGQLMHLVQDASVPAHVRNDVHIFYNYEKWLEKIRTKPGGNEKISNLISSPLSFDPAILKASTNPLAPIPISRIIDTEQYFKNRNPEITITESAGIAEYANANFFSEDTISNADFPFPRIPDLDFSVYPIPDPRDTSMTRTVARQFYMAPQGADEFTGYRLALVSLMKKHLDEFHFTYEPDYSLDDEVYSDYAERLLPRAVGYSAGLLGYFFRGTLQVTVIPFIDHNRLDYVMLNIKNLTPDDDMIGGAFTLNYRYTPPGAMSSDSTDIFGQAMNSVPCTLLKTGDEDGMWVYFTFPPTVNIPVESLNSLKLTLAYQGTLGKQKEGGGFLWKEDNAVIGKVFGAGELKFNEDWDKGLTKEPGKEDTGNYPWAHTGVNLEENIDNGSTTNEIRGDILVKDNIRFLDRTEARVNESFVTTLCCGNKYKPEGFPLLVTPNTYVMFKIDAMSINQITPAPPGTTTQWQGLWLYFDNGFMLEFSQEGQQRPYRPNLAGYPFTLGVPIYGNIYQLFKNAGVPIPEGPFYLQGIEFGQQLWDLGALPSTAEYWQHMEVDYIRIVEGKEY